MQKIITYRGRRLNQRTIDMFEAAEKLTGLTLVITQGSYNAGGVAKSAGTHDGGGALDIRAVDLSPGNRKRVVAAFREVGFFASLRTPAQADWPYHIHCIAVGDPDLSRDAAEQVRDYTAGRNGLANEGPDDGPRQYVGMTWEKYLKAHPPQPKELFTVGQFEDLMQQIKNEGAATRQEIRRQAIWSLRYGLQTEDEKARADRAFDDAIDAGKTLAEAIAAVSAITAPIAADLEKRAKANG